MGSGPRPGSGRRRVGARHLVRRRQPRIARLPAGRS
jgi:hypothetical protein